MGFWVTNSCEKVRIKLCGSQGHQSGGFVVDTGCTDGVISYCTSGGRDGIAIDNGTRFHWPWFESVAGREYHAHVYPASDGEGVAGDPITLSTDAEDETNGPATTADYWGEPKLILEPLLVGNDWTWLGFNAQAVTANKTIFVEWLRINNTISASKSGGNAWDEGETVLTIDADPGFQAADLVWITSDYKPDGEIQIINSVVGNVITVFREGSQFGGANTGLRWDHTTNDPGTEKMYLVFRNSQFGMHQNNSQLSFGSAKDSAIINLAEHRHFHIYDGLLARSLNQTDGTNGTEIDLSIMYREGTD